MFEGLSEEELRALEAVAQRAVEDFRQRQNNAGDYVTGTMEWEVYVRSYGILLKHAKDNGEAI